MTQTLDLPSLNPVPDDIDDQLRHLIRNSESQPTAADPALEEWLLELIKNSGHLSTGDDMRWRLLSIVWLATRFDVDKGWPYLMWLNMNEPVISDHLAGILTEAVDDLDCHVEIANWIAQSDDERLITFFSEYRHIPGVRKIPAVLNSLLARPTAPETGVWLAAFCRDTAEHVSPHVRRWCLAAAAWYATCFDPDEGLDYLREHSNGAGKLSPENNKMLMETTDAFNGTSAMIQWIADSSDPAVKTMLAEFGHPELSAHAEEILQQAPDYDHLAGLAEQATVDANSFKQAVSFLEEAGVSLSSAKVLDLACGILAPQTVLFNSTGYKTTGVDLHIPPGYLPLPGLKYWFRRRKHAKAWREATTTYYEALSREAGLSLRWRKVKIELADLTRLPFEDQRFSLVICLNYLQHAPDVNSLLAEAARVLQPGGLLLADIVPYAALSGAYQSSGPVSAWNHLRDDHHQPVVPLNKWRETQYRAAFEKYFTVEQWLTEQDAQAQANLTPEVKADLPDFSEAELTRRRILVLTRRR